MSLTEALNEAAAQAGLAVIDEGTEGLHLVPRDSLPGKTRPGSVTPFSPAAITPTGKSVADIAAESQREAAQQAADEKRIELLKLRAEASASGAGSIEHFGAKGRARYLNAPTGNGGLRIIAPYPSGTCAARRFSFRRCRVKPNPAQQRKHHHEGRSHHRQVRWHQKKWGPRLKKKKPSASRRPPNKMQGNTRNTARYTSFRKRTVPYCSIKVSAIACNCCRSGIRLGVHGAGDFRLPCGIEPVPGIGGGHIPGSSITSRFFRYCGRRGPSSRRIPSVRCGDR